MLNAIAQKIAISVETCFQARSSNPEIDLYVYSYRITIKNESEYTVQLISRAWIIFDATMEKRIVEGNGVVGEQPILSPNESYQYVSYCQLKTDAGSMKGYYRFQNSLDNTHFEVPIPEFILIPEYRLN